VSEFQSHISNFFVELLQAHGLVANRHNDWVITNGEYPGFRAFYTPPPTENTVGELAIQILLGEGALIEESFAAIGDSHKAAINGALHQFMICMFHPIISACCKYSDDDQITQETWKLKLFSTVDVWYGNVACRVQSDTEISVPHDWVKQISSAVKNEKTNIGFNWINLYCFRLNSDPLRASATFNNVEWAGGLQATTSLNWPEVKGFYGARLFILMRR